jgi:hypothetical protein
MVIGSTAQFSDKSFALLEVAVLRRKINLNHRTYAHKLLPSLSW